MSKNKIEPILDLLREGRFTQDGYKVTLESGIQIWTANGAKYYSFYPDCGVTFTWVEKWQIKSAMKDGLLKQAVKQSV